MKANPLSNLAIIPAFSREPFIPVLASIIFECDTDFLHVSWQNESPLSSKATIFEQNRSTIFRTSFSYEALIILFEAINTDLTCKHIWKAYGGDNPGTVIHTSRGRNEV